MDENRKTRRSDPVNSRWQLSLLRPNKKQGGKLGHCALASAANKSAVCTNRTARTLKLAIKKKEIHPVIESPISKGTLRVQVLCRLAFIFRCFEQSPSNGGMTGMNSSLARPQEQLYSVTRNDQKEKPEGQIRSIRLGKASVTWATSGVPWPLAKLWKDKIPHHLRTPGMHPLSCKYRCQPCVHFVVRADYFATLNSTTTLTNQHPNHQLEVSPVS